METNKNKGSESRREIIRRPLSRAGRLKRLDARGRDERKIGRYASFGEWVRFRESDRDASWLASERARLMGWREEDLLRWLRWNDPNGVYGPEDGADYEPMTRDEMVDLIMTHVEENLETPEEMRRLARDPSPGATPLAWDPARLLRSRG